MTRAGFGLWAVAGGLAAWLTQAHDGRIALGLEVLVPASLFLLHMAMGAAWYLAVRRRLWIPGALVVVAWAWLVPGAPSPPSRVDATDGGDIVVVTLDTFRADHLREDWTPRLWALGQDGARYTQAVSTAPLTGPAHASMWTGLPVREHGLLANGREVQAETVVPAIRERGYRTGAFLSAHVLDRATGLDAGWDH